MSKKKDQKAMRFTVEGVSIIFKNFSGEATPYNNLGNRVFSIIVPDDLIDQLIDEGWNVKELRREEGEERTFHLPVKLGYNGRYPPRVYSVKKSGVLPLTEDTVAMLDLLPIAHADLIINPSPWEGTAGSGIKAYVHTLYAIIDENELDLKYGALPELR